MKLTRFNNCKMDSDAADEQYKIETISEDNKEFNLPNDYTKPVVFVVGSPDYSDDE